MVEGNIRGMLAVVELGVCKQTHKVCRVAGLHVVPLEVQRDVAEGDRVTINVERSDGSADVLSLLLGLRNLALEVLREV